MTKTNLSIRLLFSRILAKSSLINGFSWNFLVCLLLSDTKHFQRRLRFIISTTASIPHKAGLKSILGSNPFRFGSIQHLMKKNYNLLVAKPLVHERSEQNLYIHKTSFLWNVYFRRCTIWFFCFWIF